MSNKHRGVLFSALTLLFLFYVGLVVLFFHPWHFLGEAAVSAAPDTPTSPVPGPIPEHLPPAGWTVPR